MAWAFGCNKGSEKIETKRSETKALHQMSPAEVGEFVGRLQMEVPRLGDRVVAIARRNLHQPYKISLLGEFPFEAHDSDPLFCLDSGDCVVFIEHVYAMALAKDWDTFFALLQRIRYQNGEISVFSRNHYILADWNKNNSWLLRDITVEIAGAKAVKVIEEIDRQQFLEKTFKLRVALPVQNYETTYVPAEAIKDVASKLANGDFVNIIRRKVDGSEHCGHVGLIAVDADGTATFINSTKPEAVEKPLVEYVLEQMNKNVERETKGHEIFLGMKFLRLQDNPITNLLAIDGPDAPTVTGPKGLIRKRDLR